jgi:hypothetical protein
MLNDLTTGAAGFLLRRPVSRDGLAKDDGRLKYSV